MDGSGARSLEQALVDVPGIDAVEIERGPNGPRTLRLSVAEGRDRGAVMAEVHRVLGTEFGLALASADTSPRPDEQVLRAAVPERARPAAGDPMRMDGPRLALVTARPADPEPTHEADEVTGAAAVDEDGPRPGRDRSRPRCTRVRVWRRGLAAVAEVRITSARGSADGTADGAPTGSGMRRAAAEATAAALRTLPTRPGVGPVRVDIDDVAVVPLAGGSTVVVSVTRTTGDGSVTAVGAATVHRDDRVAAVRAVLDAAGESW
ncbi:MAG: hypothetical protein R2737_02500 [Candidatus Nanopelagicales bacterium]